MAFRIVPPWHALEEPVNQAPPATLLKKRLWHRRFPVNFAKFLRTRFLHATPGILLLEVVVSSHRF